MDGSAVARLMILALVAAGMAGCGGGSSSPTATVSSSTASSSLSTTSSSLSTSTTTTSRAAPTSAVTTGPVRARLVGANHRPRVAHPWSYTVTARNAAGRPLAGTAETEFALGGLVVGRETPPIHTLKNGRLHDTLTFPAAAKGRPLQLQVVVHTHVGTVTLVWPVMPG